MATAVAPRRGGLALLAWFVLRSSRLRGALGRFWLRLTPETGGRGLWRNRARRRVIRELVVWGDASRLLDGSTQLPARVCVVEPDTPLEGAMFAFDPERAARFIESGARDAAAALERAGWLAE